VVAGETLREIALSYNVDHSTISRLEADADIPAESIVLNFAKFEFDYSATKPDGTLGTESFSSGTFSAAKSS
jgi:transcriptional regulator with XRE-family HTH domain